MSPELITAIKERLAMGYELEVIRAELKVAGYDEQTIEAAISTAQSAQSAPTAPIPTAGGAKLETSGTMDTLPGVQELLKEGFAFAKQRPDVLALVIVPLVLMTSLEFSVVLFGDLSFVNLGTSLMLALAFILVYLAVLIFYLVALTATLHLTFQNSEQRLSVGEGLHWGRRHVLGLLWVWILSGVVIWGGFVLLIIPGIIVMVYTALSQYVYVAEGQRGLSALLRSHALVKGNWWPLATRLFLVSLFFLLVFFVIALLAGLLLILFGLSLEESTVGEFAFNLVAQVLGGVFLVVGLKIGFMLYQALATSRPLDVGTPPVGKWKYVLLAVIAGLLVPLAMLAAVILASLSNARDMGMQASFKQELSAVRVEAEWYSVNQNQSYEGFCATVSDVSYGTVRECVDSENGWAMVVVSAVDEVQYCTDSENFPAPGQLSVGEASCEFDPDPKQRAGELRQAD
jgi:hypothetical protein